MIASRSHTELAEALIEVCRGVQRILTTYEVNRDPDELDFLVYQVNTLYRIVIPLSSCSSEVVEVLVEVGVSLSLLQEVQRSERVVSTGNYVPQLVPGNGRGRPRLNIQKEQLEYLLHLGFKCPQIAAVIGVSLSTVRRRMTEYGLSVTALYSNITNRELDTLITQIMGNFPNCGYRMVEGHLLRQGHRITHARIRVHAQGRP